MSDDLDERVGQCMRDSQWQGAVDLLESVPEPERTFDQNWTHGWALFQLDQPLRAAASLRRALLLDHKSMPAHFALGAALSASDKLVEAERRLLDALAIEDASIVRLCLAVVYMKQDRAEDAERVHLEGLQKRPRHIKSVEAYADFLSDCGREQEAQAQYAKAAKLTLRRQIRLQPITSLPDDFADLIALSLSESFGALQRMRDEWDSGVNRFDAPGEVVFEARIEARLVGVCGLNRDPYAGSPDVGRVRHLYVDPAFRRRGVGRALVSKIIQCASASFTRLRLRTSGVEADQLYVALGFRRVTGEADVTHER